MAHLGFIVFLVGLTVASWFASKVVPAEEGTGALAKIGVWGADAGLFFAVGILLMVVGGVIARRANKPEKPKGKTEGESDKETTGLEGAMKLLDDMSERLSALDASTLPEGGQALADELDAILSDQIPDFLDHRTLLIDRLGLATFAEMIGSFAQMERGAARAWSAITDEAWAEVPPSLDKARTAVKRARAAFDS